MTTISKEDIEECRRRVEAWWNHELINRAVVQFCAPLNRTKPRDKNFSEMTPEAVDAMYSS